MRRTQSLSFFEAPSARARVAEALAWLGRRSTTDEILVVVPSLESGRELLVRGARSTPEAAAFGWRRTTPGLLASDLASVPLARRDRTPVGALAVEAVLARVVHDLEGSGSLGRFDQVKGAPGFVRALARTIGELRLEDVSAETLDESAPELATILRELARRLEAEGLADRASILAAATELSADTESRHPLLDLPTLLLDVPVRSRREASLLAAVLARSPDALASLPAGDGASRRRLEEVLAELGIAAADATPRSPDPDAGDAAEPPTALSRLQRFLFEPESPEPAERDGSLLVLSAPGKSRESVEIARKVRELAADGIPFDRMAVLLRTPGEYRAHLEEALDRADVPAYWERGVVRPDPAGRAFLALLRCRAERYSAKRFAEYLSLGEVPDADPEGAPPETLEPGERWAPPEEEGREPLSRMAGEFIEPSTDAAGAVGDEVIEPSTDGAPVARGTLRAPRRWERLIVEASVVDRLQRWRRRLDGLVEQKKVELRALRAEEDGSEAKAERIEREIEDLGHLKRYALPLLEELDRLPAEADWVAWLDGLSALASRSLRAPERVLQLLTELASLGPVGPVDLDEVIRVLSEHLLELARLPEGTRHGKLFVGDTGAVRGRSFEVVFVPGLAEHLFPRQIREDPVLLDADRRRLSPRLPTNDDRIAEERLALRLAAGAASRTAVLSYPRMDADLSRPRVPSFYALEALRAAEGTLPLFEELARRADAVTEARIGWPAPRRAERAIDAAEYDLAVLDAIQGRAAEDRTGAAHYLLAANPHLGRALRARAYRWGVRAWTRADGLVKPGEAAREALEAYRLGARATSATALQNYAVCPYKYFLSAVHRLEPRERPEALETLDPLQKGSLIHDIQFACLSRLRDAGLLPVRPARLEEARAHLDEAVDRIAGEYRERLAPAIGRVWEKGIESIRADLRRWLSRAAEDGSGFVPWRFELGFGIPWRDPQDPASTTEPVELEELGIRLRGAIDLVERREADGALRITDHKTGRARVEEGAVVDGGEALQPVLYPLAAERLFPETEVVSGRLYYCTSTGEYRTHEVPLDETARKAMKRVVELVRGATDAAFLPALPQDGACRWCDYAPVCGPLEERRTRRKPDVSSVRTLRELR